MSEAGERLQKVLARAGAAPSRRKAEALIEAGRVTVDGLPVTLGARVAPGADVRLDGRPVGTVGERVVLALHKRRGVVTTRTDPQGRPTVFDELPVIRGLHAVGRLDLDSEGLLLLTTDGDLTMRLTHPRFGHAKRYRVWCAEGRLDRDAAARLRQGVTLEDGPARAAQVTPGDGGAVVELLEGRKRLVRRMFAAVGLEVTRLLRTHVAGLPLGDLPIGAHRVLEPNEVALLGYTRPRTRRRRS